MRDQQFEKPAALPCLLKKEIMKITSAVRCLRCRLRLHGRNVEKILRAREDADILFIEATFLEADAALAEMRRI